MPRTVTFDLDDLVGYLDDRLTDLGVEAPVEGWLVEALAFGDAGGERGDEPDHGLRQRMEEVAEATGTDVIVGVRPHGRGWFAHADGVAMDGGSPDAALEGVVASLIQASSTKRLAATREIARAERIESLGDTSAT